MDTGEFSFKVYLIQPNVSEPEVRKFRILGSALNYHIFVNKLVEIFSGLSGKSFSIYWKDDEEDEVAVSSPEEFHTALMSMKTEVKKFIVKVEGVSAEKKNTTLHPHIFCDRCECNIAGSRYKCIICTNYDLCQSCEKSGAHNEHPMLKIPDPHYFKYENLQKIIHFMKSNARRDKHRNRNISHKPAPLDDTWPEFPKEHKKCEKRESNDTDESEDECHRKHSHSHKKFKKGKCPYTQMMSDVFTLFSSKPFQMKTSQGWADGSRGAAAEETSRAEYLRSVGMTLQKFLDPLGVEVDFEVRPNGAKKGQKKKEEQENGTPPPTPSAPRPSSSQKGPQFADPAEITKQKMDEIAQLLAKQTMNGSNDNTKDNSKKDDNDGWVEFEELARAYPDPRASGSTGAIPKVPQQQEEASGEEKKQPETSKPLDNQTLYPNLSPKQLPTDPAVRSALEKMLAMGFTNEGNWLTQLLEAKHGNINLALEALDPRNKESNRF